MNDNYVPVRGLVKVMTKKALLLAMDDCEEYWIPFSVIFEDDLAEVDVGVIGEINVAEWFYDREMS